jgi:multiple sugar transport system permease protein/raffinose/stachyose/melibiose transport system permease protein
MSTVLVEGPPRPTLLLRWRTRLRRDPTQASWQVMTLFLTPALLMYAAFTAYPVVRTFYNSLHLIKPRGQNEFVGWANYIELLSSDTIFWKAVVNTMTWAGVAPLIDVATGLLLALCLYAKVPLARFFRVAWFTPVLISYVVVAILWMWIYNYDWGVANVLLRGLGLGELAHSWLGDPDTALWALIFAHAWKWAGFNMVVCLAALHALPSEVIEAAELDNCGWLKKLWFIIIPMIRPTLVNLLILAFIGKMKVFDLVWIMTQGGPLWSTETVSTYVYKRAFEWNTFDLGYPSAIASVWFVVVLAFVLGLSALFRQRDRLEY